MPFSFVKLANSALMRFQVPFLMAILWKPVRTIATGHYDMWAKAWVRQFDRKDARVYLCVFVCVCLCMCVHVFVFLCRYGGIHLSQGLTFIFGGQGVASS